MGNLVIKKVSYEGDKYHFESPELSSGINLVIGDNGSGKSTFSYFIEYGLGGTILPFSKKEKDEKKNNSKYEEIRTDSNNCVKLEIEINKKQYVLKRFINTNEIYFEEDGVVDKLPIFRNKNHSPKVFSDWLLSKLEISVYELNLGKISWLISFNDLFRLLNYDQDTEASKIFKNSNNSNFVSDSTIIRKSIFETLLGASAEKYNTAYNNLRNAEKVKSEAKSSLSIFYNNYKNVNDELVKDDDKINALNSKLHDLMNARNTYQKQETNVDDKVGDLSKIQAELVDKELRVSEYQVKSKSLEIELDKVRKLSNTIFNEITQLEKIIFTNDKLNLFSFELCPFCMEKVTPVKGFCICGNEVKNNDYEKFVYKSNEYKEILSQKLKSSKTIDLAKESFIEELSLCKQEIRKINQDIDKLKMKLIEILKTIEFSGNSQLIDTLNDEILEVKSEIKRVESINKLLTQRDKLQNNLEQSKTDLKVSKDEFEKTSKVFLKDNRKMIDDFSKIYSDLLANSSCKSNFAEINDDYMPYIDKGKYKERSSIVPIRLMYYFSFLSMGIKEDNVKHPKFLLIDTPQGGGIDESNLKQNIKLLDNAIKLAYDGTDVKHDDFQVILTTGLDKFPEEYRKYIKIRFCKKDLDFILKKKVHEEKV